MNLLLTLDYPLLPGRNGVIFSLRGYNYRFFQSRHLQVFDYVYVLAPLEDSASTEIATSIGAIPEILRPEDLVPPDETFALAKKLREVVSNDQRLNEMSAHNLKVARLHSSSACQMRRIAFYAHLREYGEKFAHFWQRDQAVV